MKLISKIVPILLLAAAGANPARADFNPVPLTPSSFTFDIVVSSNAPPPGGGGINFGLTATTGAGTGLGDNSFVEEGKVAPPGDVWFNFGIPVHNTVFTNINNSSMAFVMPPNYLTNNDLQLDGATTTGTLGLVTETNAISLAILCTDGNGAGNVNYSVNHVSGPPDTGTIFVHDWFDGGSQVAWGANGREQANGNYNNGNNSSVNNNPPYLYAVTISVSGASPVTSVDFTHSSGGENNFFGISASTDGTHYLPAPVGGFNQIATIAATYPSPLNATMDSGTNLNFDPGTTWFEQGYDSQNPTYGLPPSGTTFASQSYPTHFYQMGSYTANNAILIDSTHLVANITPAAQNAYTSFAFLTAGGNIGGGNIMTNICILQHLDGVQETNLFFGYDWFEGSVPPAWTANERLDMGYRTFENTGSGFPRLFESFFVLNDTASPVTNIMVLFKTAPGGNATTYIMAVSASAGGVPPLITSGASPATQEWYPTQSASMSVLVSGTAPLTNTWLVQQGVDVNNNPIFVPLTNGLDANGSTIYNSGTTTLLISNLTLADGNNYEYIAANALGSATSAVASVTINTGTPNAPIIDSQTPAANFTVLTNHPVVSVFSLAIDGVSAPPFNYQWYTNGTPDPAGTNATYAYVDTNPVTIYCGVTNFVGGTVSTPVSITIVPVPPLSPYQTAVFNYNPLAYWPLEETSGSIAFDYAGTNNGVYEGNYQLDQTGLPATAGVGANVSAGFDGSTAYVEVPVGNLNITGPMTVIQWVQAAGGGDAGFTTTVGHGDSGWRLDDVGGQAHFADAGPDVTATSPNINDGNWHQLVGVYDGTTQYLYVDGQPAGSPLSGGAPSGSTGDVRIGGAPDYGNRMFDGNICQVAVIGSALSAGQVLALYNTLDTPPIVSITPASPSVYSGQSITLTATLSGTPATSLQWFKIDTSNVSNNIGGAIGATYTIPPTSTTPGDNGDTFGIIAANAYGTNIAEVTLSVQSTAAFLAIDISPLTGEAYTGAPVRYTVNAQGSLPIYYQWYVDSAAVAGATNASYTAPAQCGSHTYQVSFTNAESGGTPVFSSVAALQGDASPTNITFNTDGTGWQLNASAGNTAGLPGITSGVLELTDGTGNEDSSAYYSVAQYVGRFTASFTYTAQDAGADGTAFVIQNAAAGAFDLGGGGGGLGYLGVTNSVALEINLYNGNGEVPGIAPGTNGVTFGDGGREYAEPGPINVNSGDPINVTLNWANGIMSLTFADTSTHQTYSTNFAYGPITSFLGGSDLAYIGFSGGDGGATSIQTISNFEFNSVIPPVDLAVSPSGPGTFIISWPSADPNYQLQTTTSLTSPSWVAGPSPTVVGGLDEVTINANTGTGAHFYRLAHVVSCQ